MKKNTDLYTWNMGAYDYLQDASEKNNPWKKLSDTPSFITLLGNIAGRRLLDLGCGNGDLCRQLAKRGARVIGLDGSSNMLHEAEMNFSECTYVLCDLMHDEIPFADSYFDIVTAKMLLDVVSSFKTVSIKAFRILKHKGLYAIEIPHPIRPYIKKGKSIYKGIVDYREEVQGKIQFAETNFSYYHRSISYYINELINMGFVLYKIQEVIVDEKFVKRFPQHQDKRTFPTSWQLLFEKP